MSYQQLFEPCVPAVKKWFLYSVPIAVLLLLAGSVSVDRESGRSGRQAVNAKLRDVSQGNFPANAKLRTHPFKKEAFDMAVNCQVAIIPVIFPRGHDDRIATVITPVLYTDKFTEIAREGQNIMQWRIDSEMASAEPSESW
ncbi:hypothetical protein HPB48_003418 [Haemaphysalis longicornis]|uniref:Uncharacterized protein n=1 Tax=Haemaphysalis longicornis TaxID=44386 RepID=A0A9J6GS54_HAELO|nr:hypothetical protein HPB48_003418 [Haemaphysalis longicornis]